MINHNGTEPEFDWYAADTDRERLHISEVPRALGDVALNIGYVFYKSGELLAVGALKRAKAVMKGDEA